MDRRTTITLVIVSIVIISGIFITFYILGKQTGTTTPASSGTGAATTETTGNLFPTSENINGSSGGQTTPTKDTAGGEQAEETAEALPQRISGGMILEAAGVSVGGITFVNKEGEPSLRYIEKGTGHINEIAFSERIPTKVSNTTITGVNESYWGKDGSVVIFKRLESPSNSIQTIYGVIEAGSSAEVTAEGSVGKLIGTVLPVDTMGIAISPAKDKVFYTVKQGDSTIGIISPLDVKGPSSNKIQVWNSPVSEWIASWPKTSSIYLQTRASSQEKGYLYSISLDKSNKLKREFGDVIGFTAKVSPSGGKTLYSETTGTGFVAYFSDTASGGISMFPARTLPEKCVWDKQNESTLYCGVPRTITGSKYPDSWYQGAVSFTDEIWKIDLDTNSGTAIIDANTLGENNIDVTNPILSDDGNYLGFINKKTGHPFIVKLK